MSTAAAWRTPSGAYPTASRSWASTARAGRNLVSRRSGHGGGRRAPHHPRSSRNRTVGSPGGPDPRRLAEGRRGARGRPRYFVLCGRRGFWRGVSSMRPPVRHWFPDACAAFSSSAAEPYPNTTGPNGRRFRTNGPRRTRRVRPGPEGSHGGPDLAAGHSADKSIGSKTIRKPSTGRLEAAEGDRWFFEDPARTATFDAHLRGTGRQRLGAIKWELLTCS